jgi:hypothetical protein
LPRRSRRRSYLVDVHPFEGGRDMRKDRIAIVQEIVGCLVLRKGVSQLLCRPCCCWMRGDRLRFPTSGALRESEVRPTAGSSWTSRESTPGRRLARPAAPCDVGSSMSRTGESRADARRAQSLAARREAPHASRAIAATARPTAPDQLS